MSDVEMVVDPVDDILLSPPQTPQKTARPKPSSRTKKSVYQTELLDKVRPMVETFVADVAATKMELSDYPKVIPFNFVSGSDAEMMPKYTLRGIVSFSPHLSDFGTWYKAKENVGSQSSLVTNEAYKVSQNICISTEQYGDQAAHLFTALEDFEKKCKDLAYTKGIQAVFPTARSMSKGYLTLRIPLTFKTGHLSTVQSHFGLDNEDLNVADSAMAKALNVGGNVYFPALKSKLRKYDLKTKTFITNIPHTDIEKGDLVEVSFSLHSFTNYKDHVYGVYFLLTGVTLIQKANKMDVPPAATKRALSGSDASSPPAKKRLEAF